MFTIEFNLVSLAVNSGFSSGVMALNIKLVAMLPISFWLAVLHVE